MGVVSGIVKESGTPVAGRIVRAYRRDTGALLGEAVSNAAGTIAGDPDYANVKLHLVGNSLADVSLSGQSITMDGVVTLDSTVAKFGGTSLKFDGTSTRLVCASSSSLDFGTGDFTVRFWMWQATPTGTVYGTMVGKYSSGFGTTGDFAVRERFASSNQLAATIKTAGGYLDIATGFNLSDSQPHFIEFIRSGTNLYLRADAVTRATATIGSGDIIGSSALLTIGGNVQGAGWPENIFFAGNLQDVQVIKGAAVSLASVPIAPFPTSIDDIVIEAGSYTISTSHAGEVQVVCLDDDAGTTYNDLIVRTTPA